MLTPEQIDELADRIVSGHEQAMVSDLLDQLVSALAKGGDLAIKDAQALETAAKANSEAVSLILAKYRQKISKESRSLIEEALAASDADDLAGFSALYPQAAAAVSSMTAKQLAQHTAIGVAQIIARDNLRMAERAQAVWYDVAAEAITRYNLGAENTDRLIARAVDRLASEGMSVIDYKSGQKASIDVAVRRHVVSQVGQMSGRMTEARLAEFDHDLVFVSAHFGARPDHAAWQGKVFSRTGTSKQYPPLSLTGYGTVTGLLGVNCRHTFGPYFPEHTTLPRLPDKVRGMDNDEYYEAVQTQRRHERAIRKTKRDIDMLDKAGVDDTNARLRLGAQQKRLKAFTDKRQLTRLPKREKAYGIGAAQPRALRVDTRPKTLKATDRPSSIFAGIPILLPTGAAGHVVPDSVVERVEVFAGRGTHTVFRKASAFADRYGGHPDAWEHTKGYARVYDESGVAKLANVHWFEAEGIGIVEPFVKGWSKKQ